MCDFTAKTENLNAKTPSRKENTISNAKSSFFGFGLCIKKIDLKKSWRLCALALEMPFLQ
jgi:hypothetical protein